MNVSLARLALAAASLAVFMTDAQASGPRCGWFDNPSPGNASLFDKDGEWVVAVQGGHQAQGDWPPRFAPSQWIKLGAGNYGHGCACLDVVVDATQKTVTSVKSGKARPLSVCRKDPSIAQVETKLQ